jgi:hypothetical protein
MHILCIIIMHKLCIIIVQRHNLICLHNPAGGAIFRKRTASGGVPEDVRERGLSSESNKTGDYDYAEVTRIMHLHNDYAKFRHADYAKFRQTVVPLPNKENENDYKSK